MLSLAALAACGSGAGGQSVSGVGAPFAARATAVCQTILEAKKAWSALPAAGFNPDQPDPAAFPVVAAWLEGQVAPTFDAWLAGLTTLGPPPSGAASWTDVLSAVDKIGKLNADQVAAAKAGDTAAFVKATNGLHAIQPELERATKAAGVPACADVHK